MLPSAEKPSKSSNVSRNEDVARLAASFKKREELDAKALKVIETLIDNPVSQAKFLDCCKHINQFHYKDLIEERALVFNCGYPLCKNKLLKIKPQKYHISVKYNKVFDISERKNFCSNICFKASKYLENQLNSSEFWLNEQQRALNVTFLPLDTTDGIPGTEVDLECVKKIEIEDPSDVQSESFEGLIPVALLDAKSIPSKAVPSKDRRLEMKPKNFVDKKQLLTPGEVVERALKEWVTVESVKYLCRCDNFQMSVEEASSVVESRKEGFEKTFREVEEQLCRKLDIQERDDEILDGKIVSESSVYRRKRIVKRKPPSYDRLLSDSDAFALKLRTYYEGTVDNEKADAKDKEEAEDEESKVFFPVVNHQEQNAIRRMIVLDKLSHVSSELMRAMCLSAHEVASDIRELVHTFRLTAKNITFKGAEWTLLAIITMKLLAIRIEKIRFAFESEPVTKHLTTLKLDRRYIDDVVERVLISTRS